MTHATKAIYRWLLSDYIKVSNISSSEQNLYTEKELVESMEKIDTMDFHSEKEVNGIKFWAYNAGHVLGAAMFMIEIAGQLKWNVTKRNSIRSFASLSFVSIKLIAYWRRILKYLKHK